MVPVRNQDNNIRKVALVDFRLGQMPFALT